MYTCVACALVKDTLAARSVTVSKRRLVERRTLQLEAVRAAALLFASGSSCCARSLDGTQARILSGAAGADAAEICSVYVSSAAATAS